MNNIDTTITPTDRIDAKRRRKSPATYAEDILDRLKTGCPFNTTFIEAIPRENRAAVEAELQRAFELWANSWIAPLCRELISKSQP